MSSVNVTDPPVNGTRTGPVDSTSHRDNFQVKALPADFYVPFLSLAAKNRNPSPIRSLLPLEATPGIISLLAGKPNAATFPFTSLSFTARSPIDPSRDVPVNLSQAELAKGLQYGETAGIPQLRDWLIGLQEHNHGRRQGEGWRLSVGSGSQDLIYKAVTAMINPGDPILVESPVYAGVIPMFQSLHCDQIEVETDSHGILASSLRSILDGWPANKPKPRVLYTVPYGCNPTGMTATLERRKEVLQLAREHNFIILEGKYCYAWCTTYAYPPAYTCADDPYYYLYFGEAPRYPSYFSLELEEPEVGRVLRFDSLSKILSAGIRIGFASGPEPLLDAMDRHTSTSNLQPSSLTQVITFALLDSWGYDGFKAHTDLVSSFYREKRDIFERALKTHLSDLVEWDSPEAGLFFWFKLRLGVSEHEEGDSESVIRTNAFERGVIALPGTVFLPNGRKTAYVRASFSAVGEEDAEEGIKRLRDAILDARAKSVKTE
ncbi:pyridoxal phosphate-dependent transferase [Desarmillaria tabescens]|uniref:Pyridoxal phosphate-dependent transferase n=1 Tax=Armillaria tabescens TaxID=1929756 RepID=A0AA39NPQ6_ARMTA|nr:pyridoxal phosphate-dependent transferase [Desarmillaria tabescens]KAK0469533.1 pyridoxal phosphate-dependent transferase [Desarmillaria tabescens]